MLNYKKLTDEQLIYLLKLRLINEGRNMAIQSITVKNKSSSLGKNYSVEFLVKSDEYADEAKFIVFNKFFENEFRFLDKCLSKKVIKIDFDVCEQCESVGITDINCICVDGNYKTIKRKFDCCVSCKKPLHE